MRMFRTSTLLSGLALTATLGVAACQNPRSAPISPPNATADTPPPTSSPSTSATPNTYKAVKKPCNVVDFGPLETVLGKSAGELLPQKSSSTGRITFMTCSRRLGPATAATTVLVEMDTFTGASAEAQYRGLRTVQQRSTPVTDVLGIGQGAYTRIDSETGPHLTVYDGNLYLEIAALGVTAPTTQTQLLTAMTQTSRQILASLKS